MAFENLFIRTKRELAGIQLDAVIQENHSNRVRLTKNPVEFGADINDHAIIEPKSFSMFAIVSDTPLGTAAFGKIVDSITGLFGTSTSENLTRSQQAYNALVKLQEAREPIQVQSKLVLYDNFIIVGIDVIQDKDTSRKVDLNITFEEVLIVDTDIIEFPADTLAAGDTREQASSTKKRGAQSPVTPTASENRSYLKNGTDFIRITK